MSTQSPMGCLTCGTPLGAFTQPPGLTYFENDSTLIESYVDRVGAPRASDWIPLAIQYVLRARRMYTAKKAYSGEFGDCGNNTSIGLGVAPEIGKIDSIAGAAVAGVATVGGLATSGIGAGAAFAATTAGAVTAAAGIITAGIGLVALPFILIFEHHAQAVAKEQHTLCDVVIAYDQFADQIEPLIQSGQITLQNAVQLLEQVQQQLQGALAGISQGSGKDCNAGCGFGYILNALVLYNIEVLYPKYAAQSTALLSSLNSLDSSPQVIPGVNNSTAAKGLGLLLGAFLLFKALV
jgi:hypothetical protein